MPDGITQSPASSSGKLAMVPTSSADSPDVRAAAPCWKNPVAEVVKGLAKLITTSGLVYLTYLFTMYLAQSGQSPASVPEESGVGARKEVIAAGNAKPKPLPVLPTSSVPGSGPQPGPFASIPAVTTAQTETAAANPAASKSEARAARPRSVRSQVEATASNLVPARALATGATLSPPGSARGGLTKEQLYKAVCQACHDVDGKGGMVRKLMPEIPDFTDSKWQQDRTDADLIHSIKEGKGRLMLPMKDRLSQAGIKPEEMVAFVRAFKPSAVVTAPATGSPARPEQR